MGKEPIVTPEFVINYPNLFKAVKNDMGEVVKWEYTCVALFPFNADLAKLREVAKQAVVKQWGDDPKKWPKKLKSPFRLQDEKEKDLDDGSKVMPEGYFKGAYFMNLKSQNKPKVFTPGLKLMEDPTEIYSGCIVKASLSVYAYDKKGNQGVAFGLQMVQKIKDGEPLSGRAKPEECFAPISGGTEEDSDASEASNPFDS